MSTPRGTGYAFLVSLVVAFMVLTSVCVGGLMVGTGISFASQDGLDPGVVFVVGVGLTLLVLPYFTLRHHVRWLKGRRAGQS